MHKLNRRYSVDNRPVKSLRGGDRILCQSGDVRSVAAVQSKGTSTMVRFDGHDAIPMPTGAWVNVIVG